MKEFKGTPGPWHVSNEGCMLIRDDAGLSIVAKYVGYTNDEEEISNANLIATAPELLSALQEVIKSLEITLRVGYERIIDLGGECDSPEVMIKGHSEIARAKAAIAKALGESQSPA